MAAPFAETIESLRGELESFREENAEKLGAIDENLEALIGAIDKIGRSASGSWLGYHANLYYQNFRPPPPHAAFDAIQGFSRGRQPGWTEKTEDEVKEAVYSLYNGPTLEDLNGQTTAILEDAEELLGKLVTEFSVLRGREGLESEVELLDDLEAEDWGFSPKDFVEYASPKKVTTLDYPAAGQGRMVPPHVEMAAHAYSMRSKISGVDKFLKGGGRLVRQVELKIDLAGEEPETQAALAHVRRLCERFRLIARKLQDRYDGRPTLEVEDEYDVQDLLHALLKLYFDDVRPEEWTPSYAGGSSRVDFLLKEEKLVVEVKKTRKRLKDKQVRDQLVVDAACYKAHPDCHILFCFVYDPEGYVGNPRGLEADLEKLSSDDLSIVVVVAP